MRSQLRRRRVLFAVCLAFLFASRLVGQAAEPYYEYDAIDDAILMGCTAEQVKREFRRLVDELEPGYSEIAVPSTQKTTP